MSLISRLKAVVAGDDYLDDDFDELDPASDTTSMKVSTAKTTTIPIEELVKRVNSNEVDYDMVAQLVKHLVFQKEKGV